jgi:hypothetical protein
MGTVVSINVGLPRDVEWQGKVVCTAIWKRRGAGDHKTKNRGARTGLAKFVRFAVLLAFTVAISYDNAISGMKLVSELIRGRADDAVTLIEDHPIGRSVYLLEEILAMPVPQVVSACQGLAGVALSRISAAVRGVPGASMC